MTKVLMVDDEEISRYLVRQLLPRGAYELNEAATAADGIQQLRAARPDVVLLDLMMANIDGFEFLERETRRRSDLRGAHVGGTPPARPCRRDHVEIGFVG